MARRSKGDGLRITKVGLWFLVFLLVVGIAATNTGNNGLFLVLAVMGGAMAASDVAGRWNVRGLEVGVAAPAEIFANSPSRLEIEVKNLSRWLPRWLLLLAIEPEDVAPPLRRKGRKRTRPLVFGFLPRGGVERGGLELLMRRRGLWRVRAVHVTTLFPLGFFRKGRRQKVDLELLVFPEVFAPSVARPAQLARSGEEPTRRAGWGHELLGLRGFRYGDDPRNIHWKQTARTGDLIMKERETEESRRLLIVFDNAVGRLEPAGRRRFERLVSEAATAALDYLDGGYEVSLLTRDHALGFASGARQRFRILEALALVEPRGRRVEPLPLPDAGAPHLRLAMEPEEAVA